MGFETHSVFRHTELSIFSYAKICPDFHSIAPKSKNNYKCCIEAVKMTTTILNFQYRLYLTSHHETNVKKFRMLTMVY